MSDVRVRFAPSPTGELHIGSVRTILYNYLFAKQRSGELILRIEDTDQERLVPTAIDSIYAGLHWLGIRWDEGPREGGPFAPYVQSERLALYREHADRLLERGVAYPCFCTKERLAEMRKAQEARHELTRYDRRCRSIPPAEAKSRVDAGEPRTIRLKVPDQEVVGIDDLVHGPVAWDLGTIEDQIVMKSDGFPTYHLAVVVDDHAMHISHIIRGEEWLPSVPKHLVIYRAFGWDVPPMAHLPSVLGPDKKKLSKRHGSTAVREFRERGYLPEALVNFLALIGWSPGTEEEIFSMDDLIRLWRLERVQKGGGIWDKERLDYFNGTHLRRLSDDELTERLADFLPAGTSPDVVRAAAPVLKERIKTLADAWPMLEFLFVDDVDYPTDLLLVKQYTADEVRAALERVLQVVEHGPFMHERLETALRALADEIRWTTGDLFKPMRIALTGRKVGLPMIESMLLLGRERTLARLRDAAMKLRGQPVA